LGWGWRRWRRRNIDRSTRVLQAARRLAGVLRAKRTAEMPQAKKAATSRRAADDVCVEMDVP
jgi:hypothetical protein